MEFKRLIDHHVRLYGNIKHGVPQVLMRLYCQFSTNINTLQGTELRKAFKVEGDMSHKSLYMLLPHVLQHTRFYDGI